MARDQGTASEFAVDLELNNKNDVVTLHLWRPAVEVRGVGQGPDRPHSSRHRHQPQDTA